MAKKILIAPLDWGLGHSTRCVPLVKKLLQEGNEVFLASNGRSADFLENYFPELTLLRDVPDYAITYPSRGSFIFHLALQLPRIRRTIRAEHEWLIAKEKEFGFDQVISDNRYGLWSSNIPSTIITHQLFPVAPFPIHKMVHSLVDSHLSRFDSCWVPDVEDPLKNLSGKLSHGNVPPYVQYIGPQSRFQSGSTDQVTTEKNVLVILSGPEPQRSIFQELVLQLLLRLDISSLIVCGKPGESFEKQTGAVRVISHMADSDMRRSIRSSGTIICRSGYSTIMDLHALGRRAVLVPTPGQTEQEYLAHHLSEKCGFFTMAQDALNERSLASVLDGPAGW